MILLGLRLRSMWMRVGKGIINDTLESYDCFFIRVKDEKVWTILDGCRLNHMY